MECHTHLSLIYGKKLIWHHSPNEGKRSAFERWVNSYTGVSSGFPDFVIYDIRDCKRQVAIELKHGNNFPTDNQVQWLNFLQPSYVVWSMRYFAEAVEAFVWKRNDGAIQTPMGYRVFAEDDLPKKIKEKL